MQTTNTAHSVASWRRRHSSLAPRHGACIGVLLASHVSSKQRLAFLRQALASIEAQVQPPECLVLSWYADEPLAAEVQSMLRSIVLPFRFKCLQQRRRHSQYGHLREALAAFELEMPCDDAGAAATWLLFSDDDDLWHPHRTRLARLACAEATAEPPKAAPSATARGGADGGGGGGAAAAGLNARTRALAFGVYSYPIDPASQDLKTAREVDRAIDRRTVGIWLGACEVFQYAVRPAMLRSFLRSEAEAVLRHRFADVRFATWMRSTHKEAVRELGPDELMRLDAGKPSGSRVAKPGSKPKAPSEQSAEAQRWLLSNWLYFYRNQRTVSAVEWLGDLDDLHDHIEGMQRGAAAADAVKAATGGGRSAEQYERASTGRQMTHAEADRKAARILLKAFGPAGNAKAARQEEQSVAEEIGRMRHHAELTAMMCMQYRNAAEIAVAICAQGQGGGGGGGGAQPAGGAESGLQALLQMEQARLVHEALEHFGHPARAKGLPLGNVQDCLA